MYVVCVCVCVSVFMYAFVCMCVLVVMLDTDEKLERLCVCNVYICIRTKYCIAP